MASDTTNHGGEMDKNPAKEETPATKESPKPPEDDWTSGGGPHVYADGRQVGMG